MPLACKALFKVLVFKKYSPCVKFRFSWVEAQLDVLRQCPNVRSIKKALKDYPKALDETYERALQSISSENVQDASRLLQWLCFCARPMTVLELGEVIAVDLDKLVFDPELRYSSTLELLKTCGALIKFKRETEITDSKVVPLVDLSAREYLYSERLREFEGKTEITDSKAVRFCHESARAYLVSNRLREFRIHIDMTKVSANACIAKICLVYMIRINSFGISLGGLDTDLNDTIRVFPLTHYALHEWPGHYRKVIRRDQQEELDNLAHKLLSVEKSFDIYRRWSGSAIEVISPIYYSSLAGITGVVSTLLEEGVDPDEPPFGLWGTALGAACHAGHGDVVELLVENGAEIETSSPMGLTPLHLAAGTFGARLVRMLIEGGAENYINRRDDAGLTALHWAARSGKEETVQLLLDNGADILAADKEDLTPLDEALSEGREQIVQLLINHGADVDAFHGKHGTRLRHACRSGDERAVKILLKVGADPNLYREPKPYPAIEPGNSLQEAVVQGGEKPCGHESIVKLLLAAGADPNLHGTYPDSALRWAVHGAKMNIIQWLLDAGADINATPSGDDSPLRAAVRSGREDVVRLFLAAGADPNVQDSSPYGSPLSWAISRKLSVMEQILRDHGATH